MRDKNNSCSICQSEKAGTFFKRRCHYMPISLSAYICVIEYIVFVDTYIPKFQSAHKQFTFNSE